MIHLSSTDVYALLPFSEAVTVMERAFAALSSGEGQSPPRLALEHPAHEGVTLTMPATLPEACTVKVVSVHPRNRGTGHAVVQGLVVLLDPANGEILATLEGSALTALRTGAASGLATRYLAREDARCLALIGAGGQARTQFAAVNAVRKLEEVWIHSRTRARAESLAAELPAGLRVRVTDTPNEAIRHADIVCTATTSTTPVFTGGELPPGCHVNAIGAFTPTMRELDATTLRRAGKIVVDSTEAAWLEAGDLIQARDEGALRPDDVHAELGQIVRGEKEARGSDSEITIFKSVGNALQDTAAAWAIYQRLARTKSKNAVETAPAAVQYGADGSM